MPEVTLLNIDCLEYMKGIEDKFFDLAIVDPPYGIGMHNTGGRTSKGYKLVTEKNGKESKVYSQKKSAKSWDNKPMEGIYFKELMRVSKNQIIWGANHYISRVPMDSPCWIVWDKKNGTTDFADCELALTSFSSAVRMFAYRWNGMLQEQQNKRLAEKRIHPTQKPIKLYDWLLKNYAEPGQRILDTHLGSGSSAIAAHYGGFEFVGCEIDPDYYKAACERFDAETRQVSLFTKVPV